MDNQLSAPEDCGCNKSILGEAVAPQERETRLQFSLVIPTSQHIDTLVKVRDFLISQGLLLNSFESYRY